MINKIQFIIISISIVLQGCCMGGQQVAESEIAFNFQTSSSFQYYELYPRFNHPINGRIPNYEKTSSYLKIKLFEHDYNPVLDTKIYLVYFNGTVYDSITNIKYQNFKKDKCSNGLNTSFRHNNKDYPFSENQSIKY